MRILFIALFAFSFSYTAFSQNPVHDSTYTGVDKAYYDDGKLRTETPYVKGRKNGVKNAYSKEGKLSMTTPYNNDTIDGLVKESYLWIMAR